MLTIPEALEYQRSAARAKVESTRRPLAYTVQSMLAGSHIGIAVVLMVSTAGPFLAESSPATKLVSGLVFGVALTLVIVAGGELVTSNMMTLTQGALARRIGWASGVRTLVFCFAGNLLGALVFATLVHYSRILAPETPGGTMIASMLHAKGHETSVELFFRAILCNILVCLAVWSAVRLTSETAKLVVIFWCLFAFISSGFEHVVANMTTFWLGIIGGFADGTWEQFGRNMLVVGLGNLVGGAIFVGLAYAVSAGPLRPTRPVAATEDPSTGRTATVAAHTGAPAGQTTTPVGPTSAPTEPTTIREESLTPVS